MTREEQIQEAKDKTFPTSKEGRSYESAWAAGGFEMGAHWADEHPNLSSLWHDASEEPKIGSNIVVVDKNGQWWDIQPYDGEYDGYGDLTGWRCCVVHYNNIQCWAYIDDLLPKTK